jgi:hypothetical protein
MEVAGLDQRFNFIRHHGVRVHRQQGTLPWQGFLYIPTLVCDEKEIAVCHAWWEVRLDGAHDACSHSSVNPTGSQQL